MPNPENSAPSWSLFTPRTADGIVAEWLLDLLRDRGISLREAAAAIGVPESRLHSTYSVLPFDIYNELFEWSAGKLGEACLGINIGATMPLQQLGTLGYLVLNNATLQGFCETLEKYLPIFQRNALIRTHIKGDTGEIHYHILKPTGRPPRQDVELTFAVIAKFFKTQIGDDWSPTETLLEHGSIEQEPFFQRNAEWNSELYRRYLGANIYFDRPHNVMRFDADVLQVPIASGDTRLLGILRHLADIILQEIPEEKNIVEHVKLMITAALSDECFGAEQAARQLFTTRRTLHRRLCEQGVTYKQLRDEVFEKVAKAALAESSASITEIAFKCGYSEVSAFARAFKRLTGLTPLQYRKASQSF